MRAFTMYLLSLVLTSLAYSAVLLLRSDAGYPARVGPQFDNRIRKNFLTALTENQPDIVLLGDSMLDIGVDPLRMETRLDRKVYDIALRGSASTLWYLILKNNIVDAPVPPKYLIIFFRDSLLTVPGFRVQGRYLEQIDEYASAKEGLLIERAYLNLMSPAEIWAVRYFPPYSFRWQVRAKLDDLIRNVLPGKILGCSHECTERAMNVVFGDNNLDPVFLSNAIDAAGDYMYRPESLDFARQVEISFLPEFIRLTREHHIHLILVQMKAIEFSSATREGSNLERYRTDLKQYLERRGVTYLDFSSDSRIRDDYFYDTLHFTEEGRAAFTEILIEALEPYMK